MLVAAHFLFKPSPNGFDAVFCLVGVLCADATDAVFCLVAMLCAGGSTLSFLNIT